MGHWIKLPSGSYLNLDLVLTPSMLNMLDGDRPALRAYLDTIAIDVSRLSLPYHEPGGNMVGPDDPDIGLRVLLEENRKMLEDLAQEQQRLWEMDQDQQQRGATAQERSRLRLHADLIETLLDHALALRVSLRKRLERAESEGGSLM